MNDISSEITPEEFHFWKKHPVTQFIFNELNKKVYDLQETLAEGGTISDNAGRTQRWTAYTTGAIAAIKEVLNIRYSDMEANNEEASE
jgi:hypothetical protein